MKCNPDNVKLLLEKWSLKDQLLLFNDDSNQKIVNAINQIGDGKRYKLSFLLNAFVKMTEAMDYNYKDFEPDYDNISQSVADSDYWEEGYKEMFDHEMFWRELSNAVETEEISDFIIENSDTNDFITNTFNYGKDDGEVKQFVTKQELIDAISSFENIPELTGDLDRAKKTVNLGNQNVNNTFDLNYNDDEDEEEDEDDEDENYLQKFNTDINKTYITEFHPECIIHNYDEVAALSHVVKDKNGIIIDDLHKTIPFLTKYERARILGQRAKQIECGSRPFVKVPDNIVDSYIIAELELKQKKIPFIIRRPIPGGACEYWNLKDLEMVHF